MRIASSSVMLSSEHALYQSSSRTESLQSWIGGERPAPNASPLGSLQPTPSAVPPPKANNSAASSAGAKSGINKTEDDKADAQLEPTIRILKHLIEKMFGGRIRAASLPKSSQSDASSELPLAPIDSTPARQGWGMKYKLDEVTKETEQLQFAAAGVIKTSDGKEISFNLAMEIQRVNVLEQHIDVTAGDALVDPLVLNFDGSAAQLQSGNFQFDLQSDGTSENLPLLGHASGFLALDRNKDGQINNGGELFGPTTGQGFSELARYDSDHNGWIDENDSIYSDLRLWQPTADGQGNLTTLADKGVGAIYLGSAATPFTYKDSAGQAQAATSATSVFLQENGAVGTIQQLNYLA
jgi:hypothetical protein